MTNTPEDASPSNSVPHSRIGRIAVNTAVQSATTLGILIIGLVVTPVSLNHLGLIEFGIWGYVSTTISYLALIDPGFGLIVTRYAARARNSDDRATVRRVATFGVLVWFVFLALASPVVLILVPILVNHLHLDAHERHAAIEVFYWGYVYFFISIASDTIGRILTGIGVLWLTSTIDLATRVVYGVLAVVLLIDGFGIVGLIVASTVQLLLAMFATWIAVRRYFGPIFGNPLRIERRVLRDLVSSGGWYQIASLMGALNTDTDPLVIGTFVGPNEVGLYNVASRLALQTNYLPGILQTSLLPAIAASRPDDADHDRVLRTSVVNGNRLTSLLSFSVGAAVAGLSPIIYRAWLGHIYRGVDTATTILVIACLAGALGSTVGSVLIATGQISLAARIVAAGVVANVALTIGLVVPFGITGVLIGTVAANTTVAIVGISRLNHQLGLSFRESVWTWLWRLLMASGAAAGLCRVLLIVIPATWQVGRGNACATLFLLGAMYFVVLLLGLRVSRFFDKGDIALLRKALPGPLGRLAGWSPLLWLAGTSA